MDREATDYAAYFEERGLGGGMGGGVILKAFSVLLMAVVCIYVVGYGLALVERVHHSLLTCLGVVGYGVCVGWNVFAVYRAFRRSSGLLLGVLAVLFMVVALHADWFWFFVLEGRGCVLNPASFVAGIVDAVDSRKVDVLMQGRHRSSVQTFSGMGLAFCYLGEVVVVCGVAGFVARLFNHGAFFCERCGKWAKSTCVLPPLYVRVPEAMALVALSKGDVSPLVTANPVPNGPGDEAFVVTVRYCPDCRSGMLWVSRQLLVGRGAKRRKSLTRIACLQRIALVPDAVRSLLELA